MNLETYRSEVSVERGRYPLCKKEENESHILLKCKEIRIWREQVLNKKWPQINEE
jgi:hypothetical protein